MKGLVIRNTQVKYESPASYGLNSYKICQT